MATNPIRWTNVTPGNSGAAAMMAAANQSIRNLQDNLQNRELNRFKAYANERANQEHALNQSLNQETLRARQFDNANAGANDELNRRLLEARIGSANRSGTGMTGPEYTREQSHMSSSIMDKFGGDTAEAREYARNNDIDPEIYAKTRDSRLAMDNPNLAMDEWKTKEKFKDSLKGGTSGGKGGSGALPSGLVTALDSNTFGSNLFATGPSSEEIQILDAKYGQVPLNIRKRVFAENISKGLDEVEAQLQIHQKKIDLKRQARESYQGK